MPAPSSPPVDFPVYALEARWQGRRWLDSLGSGQMGQPVLGVRLAHLSSDDATVVLVETLPRERFAAAHKADEVLTAVAHVPAVMLMSMTLPDSSVPRPIGRVEALMAHTMKTAQQHAYWPTVSWSIEGQYVTAHAWQFAGGWAAFTTEFPNVYLTAAGIASSPQALRFTALSEGSAYGFGLAERLSVRVAAASCRQAGSPTLPARSDWHADHLSIPDA